jgi:aminocarboxymuconate-semialdehyde decarboxylase
MRSIDIHAHMIPGTLWKAIDSKQEWHGFRHEPGEGEGTVVGGGMRTQFSSPKLRYGLEERVKDMDAQKVDVQVLSTHMPFIGYHLDATKGLALAQDTNNEIAAAVRQNSKRFAGLATLPMQDVKMAIDELERAVTKLGMKGAALDTQVNDDQWDEPKFLPFFKAAEQMGAILFYHPQPQNNFLAKRAKRHGLSNSLGVILDDAIVASILIAGGVLEACPNIRICIAHGGGPTCYTISRVDRNWNDRPATRNTPKPPSEYLKKLYYDTVIADEEALRYLLDKVGAERVVLGSDWPFVPWKPSPAAWVQGLKSLSQEEKDKILWKNLESLLGL